MISRAGWPRDPLTTAIRRCHDHSAGSGDDRVGLVLNIKTIECSGGRRQLRIPLKTPVTRTQNCAIAPNRPSVPFVGGKPDGINGIALWPGILPLPTWWLQLLG